MGMYDQIMHTIKCPKCNSNVEILEQIKWCPYENRSLKTYKIGDKIDVADGEYTFATKVRPELITKCNRCKENIYYKVIVKDGIISKFIIIDKHDSYEEVSFNVKITMNKRWANEFQSMLQLMEKFGSSGHSGIIGIYADGDGDFRPKFDFDTEFEKSERIIKNGEELSSSEIIFDAG